MKNLVRIDALTERYKAFLENRLSVQERKVVVNLVRESDYPAMTFRVKDVKDKVRIAQHSHFSAILTRLVRKGVIMRMCRGIYGFKDMDLVEHVRRRCLKIRN